MFLPDKNLMPTPDVVTPAPFTLESLIAWLETKRPEATYDYGCNGNCLIAQYLKDVARMSEPRIGGHYYRNGINGDEVDLPHRWNDVAVQDPRTFGAALTRARAYAAEAK